jgi:hypothetical protein
MIIGKPIEILLVEDNEGDVGLIEEVFEEAKIGNKLHIEEDGEEAKIKNKLHIEEDDEETMLFAWKK